VFEIFQSFKISVGSLVQLFAEIFKSTFDVFHIVFVFFNQTENKVFVKNFIADLQVCISQLETVGKGLEVVLESTKIFNFFFGKINKQVILAFTLLTFRQSPETTDFDFASCHGLLRVDNNCQLGPLRLLLHFLTFDVDAREPASVSGMTMLPANRLLAFIRVFVGLQEFEQVFVCLSTCIDPSLSALYG